MIEIKNRERQRANRRLKNKEELLDSWDAHKWLQQTYGCSMVLMREQKNLTRSFFAHPEYLKDAAGDNDNVEFWDLGPELTRPARALKLWMTLQVLDREGMASCIDKSCYLAELAETEIRKLSGWEILSPAQFGILNFRYVPDKTLSDITTDEIQEEIAEAVNKSGKCCSFRVKVTVKGRSYTSTLKLQRVGR